MALGPVDMDESRDLLVPLEAELVEHASIAGIPFRDPVGAIAEGETSKNPCSSPLFVLLQ
jgi:hypothetical protein